MKVFHSKGFTILSDAPVETPESVPELSTETPAEHLDSFSKDILTQLQELEQQMTVPGKSDMEKHKLQDEVSRLKKAKNEFDSKQKGKISQLSLDRKKLSNIFNEMYKKYVAFLPVTPRAYTKSIFKSFALDEIKEDFDILKKHYDATKDNEELFTEIINNYQSQGLPTKLYFNEDLGKYDSLRNKYFELLAALLNYSNDYTSTPPVDESLQKFNESLNGLRSEIMQDYQNKRKQLLSAFVEFVNNFIRNSKSEEEELTLDAAETKFMENIMKKEAKYFYLFQNSDNSGGYWELDKEAGQIKKLPSSKREISSSKGEPEMIKKALKDGGVWKYSIGDKVTIDSEFGFISAEVSQLLPESNYIVKNDKDLKNGIQVTESDIFDPTVSL